MKKRLLNIDELTDYTGLSKNTLYTWVCQRRIPFLKIGRLVKFDLSDVDLWLDGLKIKEKHFDTSHIF